MRRFAETIARMLQGLSHAVLRFPLTVIFLLSSTAVTWHMISLHTTPPLFIQKLMFVFLLGSFLGVTAQFSCERFPRLAKQRTNVYALALLLTLGYYLLIAGAPAIDYGVGARTAVAIFSMFCVFIWLPSYKGRFDFNSVALVHFISAFTSVLYAGVLSIGLLALIGAIDMLLFNVDSEVFGYIMAAVWISFAPIYYLSLLPRFNSEAAADRAAAKEAVEYPRILEILVANIAIPLVSAYTLVLLAYFIKIGVTHKWPIGQLGPMILGYSAAGLVIYVLASRLSNRLAVLYQRVFPMALIPVVVMQLISVYIRLRAYGVTESRYYVALFGIFSLAIAALLSLRPVTRNGSIALLAAAFAIFSILPPVDAFTVSRISQVARLENMLQSAGVLVEGQLTPKDDVTREVRMETTNILNYLNRRDYLQQVAWLPADFEPHMDMERTFGFPPTYSYMPEDADFFSVSLEPQSTLPISGYDVLLEVSTYRKQQAATYEFTVQGTEYRLVVTPVSDHDVRVSLENTAKQELVATNLEEFADAVRDTDRGPKEMLPIQALTLDAEANGYELRIIFRSIHGTYGSNQGEGTDYNMYVLVSVAE